MNPEGLSSDEVKTRTEQHLVNDANIRSSRSYPQIIFSNVFHPQNLILILSLIILLFFYEIKSTLTAGVFVFLNILVGITQEIRAKRSLDKLTSLNVAAVCVRRNSEDITIPVNQIVKDDVIILRPGDPVVVDGPLISSNFLEMDESFLTGESEYIPKNNGDYLKSGTFCVSGSGFMRAEKIGRKSYVNQVSKLAKSYKNERTPLEKNINFMLQILIVFMFLLIILDIYSNTIHNAPLVKYILEAVVITVNVVPQGLIFGITVALAYGAIKMARHKTIVHRINAIESMGQINVLCFDKTGTLTQNKLALKDIIPLSHVKLEYIKLKLYDFISNLSWMNKTALAISANLAKNPLDPRKVDEIPFNSERKWCAMSFEDDGAFYLGAAEMLVNNIKDREKIDDLSSKGLRVLAFAKYEGGILEKDRLPKKLRPLALLAIEDKIRPGIKETLDAFHDRGIRIKIISGDSPETVQSIARLSGLDGEKVLTEQDLFSLDESSFNEQVAKINLFARITPKTKAKIIGALKLKWKNHVAMIGDGVNDVPALKMANLAISIGDGAQVAKDVSDIVLLDNAFINIPRAFKEGLNIKQRLFAIIKIFFVKTVYLSLLFLSASLILVPFPFTLAQSTWIAFAIIGFPTTLIIFNVINPQRMNDFIKDIIIDGFLWGIVGAIGMISMISILRLNNSYLLLEQTMLVVFISLYHTLIIYRVQGIKLFDLNSYHKKPKRLLWIGLIGVSILFFVYISPDSMGLVKLGLSNWFILLPMVILSYLAADLTSS